MVALLRGSPPLPPPPGAWKESHEALCRTESRSTAGHPCAGNSKEADLDKLGHLGRIRLQKLSLRLSESPLQCADHIRTTFTQQVQSRGESELLQQRLWAEIS